MSTYVVSDLHGHYNEFIELLCDIKFNKNDKMYVLGDVIDRGAEPLKLLNFILEKENIVMLMGNHEKMMLDSSHKNREIREEAYINWQYNGGYTTLSDFKEMTSEERQKVIDNLAKLKWYEFLEVGGKKFFLSHAGIKIKGKKDFEDYLIKEIETEQILWNREELKIWENKSEYIMIHGHTPSGKWHSENQYEIYYYDKGRKINIDCGCARDEKLGCLRLDDMKEFYVECEKIF